MQKKIEQLGLFLTKTEDKSKSDKRIKCIYKNENVHTKKEKHGRGKTEKVSGDNNEFLDATHKRRLKKQKDPHLTKPHSQIFHSPLEVIKKSRRTPKSAEISKENKRLSKEKSRKSKHLEENHQTAKLLNRPNKAESNNDLLSNKHFRQTPSELKFLKTFFVLNKNFAGDNPKDFEKNQKKVERSIEKDLQKRSKLQVNIRSHKRKEECSNAIKDNCVLAVDSVKCIRSSHLKNNNLKNNRSISSKKALLPKNKHLSKISFSIVNIPSVPTSGIRLEKNKKNRKYYKYNCLERASEISACNKFSDSNKFYQNLSEDIDIASSIDRILKSTSQNIDVQQDASEEFIKKTSNKVKKNVKNVENNKEEVKLKKKSKRSSANLRLEPNVSVFTIDASCKSQPTDEILVKQKKIVPKSRIPILQSNLHTNKENNTSFVPELIIADSGTKEKQQPTGEYNLNEIAKKQSRTFEAYLTSTISKSENSLQTVYDNKSRKMLESRKFVAKSSISSSTFGAKSIDSGKNVTSLLLTKTYRDDDKMMRFHKRKKYSDALRSSWIGKGSKKRIVLPQVLEVRFLTVTTQNNSDFNAGAVLALPNSDQIEMQQEQDNIFNHDLPNPLIEHEIWENQELNDLMAENYSFLQKNFSSDIQPLNFDNLSISTLSNDEHMSLPSVSITSLDLDTPHNTFFKPKTIISQTNTNQISDESGYSSVKSNFFDRPEIKNLLTKPSSSDCSATLEDKVLSGRDLPSCSVESKSLQTISVAYSQKSVQIKLSEEEFTDLIDFSDPKHLENNLNTVSEVPKVPRKNRLTKLSTFFRKICPVLCITKLKEN